MKRVKRKPKAKIPARTGELLERLSDLAIDRERLCGRETRGGTMLGIFGVAVGAPIQFGVDRRTQRSSASWLTPARDQKESYPVLTA